MTPSFEEYQKFQLSNFANSVTQEQYEDAIGNVHIIQGWVVDADVAKDIKKKRQGYHNFSTLLQTNSSYAAIFLADQNFQRVAYIPWNEDSVVYCPPDVTGQPQNLDELRADKNARGYLNYLSADIKVIYSDDKDKNWKETTVTKLISLIAENKSLADTHSTNHTNATKIKSI